MAEDSGADAITVHARTKSMLYSGKADWHALALAKSAVKIPVIANGDVVSPESAKQCLEISKCDGISVGRGILGDPTLIYRIEHYLYTGEILPEPDIKQRIEQALTHCRKEIELRGEDAGVKYMKKFFAWYIKGIQGAPQYRHRLVTSDTMDHILGIFKEIKEHAG